MSNTSSTFSYEAKAFLINAITPMHPGRGGENYDVIDRLVQRDPTTNLPTIYGSSLKGALREFISHYNEKTGLNVKEIFGGDPRENKGKNKGSDQSGKYLFMGAQLVSIPVRCDKIMFMRVTSPYVLNALAASFEQLNILNNLSVELKNLAKQVDKHFSTCDGAVILEEYNITVAKGGNAISAALSGLLGDDIAVISDTKMMQLTGDFDLPVIARNQLDEGQSQNLWYEQVLPRETRFVFSILYPKEDANMQTFISTVENSPVHIGANASVGYGFCKITSLNQENK